MAGDIQVTLSLLLEDQANITQQLQAAGGVAGQKFYDGLSGPTKKAFDDLVRQADDAAKKVGLRFNQTTLRFETAKGDIVSPDVLNKISKINAGFREAKQAVEVFKTVAVSATKEAAQNFNLLESAITGVAVSLTSRLTDAAVGGLGGVKQLVAGYMELDGELRLAAAAAGETGGYERLGAIVDKVGIEAAGTTKQVAELATSLVRAGFSVDEVEGALPGVVKGAEATGTSFDRMGDIVGNTLRGFALDIDQTSRVTDVLVNAANSSNASIEGLGYTFEYTAPIAKALGVSLEDVAAAAGLMANAGIQGSVAGTGLRFGLQKLQQAAGGASPEILGLSRNQERLGSALKKLGADVTDAEGNLLPLEQVFLRLKSSLSELSRADQVRIMNIIFGEEAGSKFLSITNQSTSAISKMFAEIKNSSGATDKARKDMTGFGLEALRLQGTIDSILRGVGGVAAAALSPLLTAANATISVISGMPAPIKNTAGAIAIMATAATTASIAIGALNVAVGTIGGWAKLRESILSVAAALMGPIGAGTIAVLGVAAAAWGVYAAFNGVDKTTKTLIQTMAGLATFVAVIRGITAAQKLWADATKALAAAQAFLVALSGPSGLGRIAVAAVAAAGVYYTMGNAIKETGAETSALSEKSKGLKDEIERLGQEIEQGRKLKIDTTEAEKLKALKENELSQLENPLEIKLNIEKAEGQITSLKEQINKMKGGFMGLFGNQDNVDPKLEAQLRAAEKYRDTLKAADQGSKSNAFAALDESAKKFVTTQAEIDKRIVDLQKKKVVLPIDAKVERAGYDKQIATLTNLKGKNDIKFRATLDVDQLKAELAKVEAERKKLESTPIKDDGSIKSVASREEEKRKRINALVQRQLGLQAAVAEAQNKLVDSSEKQASAAGKQAQSEKERLDKLKASLEASKSKLENEQRAIDLGTRLISIDKGRLETIREIADAYMNMASAQAGLTQSQFDVAGARNSRASSVAEQELQVLRDNQNQIMNDQGLTREQVANRIRLKEQEISDLKQEAKRIEEEALAAAINGAAKRFEMERKVLELKQVAARIEQEGAIRTAERGVLEDRKGLADLKVKRLDPNLTGQEKAAIDEQIKLQEQSIELSNAQVRAEKERLGELEKIFALEKDTLSLKQGTEANQFRAKAAEQGTEGKFASQLTNLDNKAGTVGANKMMWADITKEADKAVGSINKHNEALKNGAKNVAELSKAYKDMSGKAPSDAQQKQGDLQKGRSDELDKQKTWQKEMEKAGIIEFKAEGIPQSEIDKIIQDVLGIQAPTIPAKGQTVDIGDTRTQELQKQKSWQKQMEDAGIIEFKAEGVPKSETDAIIRDVLGIANTVASSVETLGLDNARQNELDKQQAWKKEMEDAGIIEFSAQGVPKSVTDAMMTDAVRGTNSPIVDQWFASKEGQAAMQRWRSSASETRAGIEAINDTARQSSDGVDRLNKNLGKTAGVPKGLQGAQDQLFGQKARGELFSSEAVQRAVDAKDFSLKMNVDTTGLEKVRIDLGLVNDAVNAFNSSSFSAGDQLSSGFLNAANSIVPLANGLSGITTELQNLSTGTTNPFQGTGDSLNQALIGAQAIAPALDIATQSASGLNDALSAGAGAEQLQQAYDSLQPPDVSQAVTDQASLTDGTQGAISATQSLADSWVGVAANVQAAVNALAAFTPPPAARWSGGDVKGGTDYIVNELGRESFLSRSGALSLIQAPQHGKWTAPSGGTVLPAGLTAKLQAVGAFDHVHRKTILTQPAAVATNTRSPGGMSQTTAFRRLENSIDKLERAMTGYKPPNVVVNVPGNERILGIRNRIL